MECVAVGGKFFLVTGTADRRGLHAEFRFRRLQDAVCSVAVSADRCLRIARRDGMTVGATLVIVIYLGVAGSAGLGDVRLIGWAGRILVAEDSVRSMAALAVGRDQQALLAESEAVDRIHVVCVNAGQALLCCHGAVTVALAAGLRNVKRINSRTRVRLGEYLWALP